MEVKEGVKIYNSIPDVREFEPLQGEFIVFQDQGRGKTRIFVEEAGVRCIGEFYNFEDAFRYAKFKKQEGDINSLFEKYERKCDQLSNVVDNLDLRQCSKCGNFHQRGHICYECRHDPSA